VATVVISFWLCTYYNVIISWAMFYMAHSFIDPLPWTNCNNWC
jgi:SNF family Na+-dependent transporter